MINKLVIDSTDTISDLCQIMAQNKSDKSPLLTPLLSRADSESHGAASIVDNLVSTPLEYAHGYTGVYDFLVSQSRSMNFSFRKIFSPSSYRIIILYSNFPKFNFFISKRRK